ncbi:MAG: UDP-N-acetylmuramoyl-L-alanine--D-glutamate ligase, partial [Patescibacteria group bacterium]
MKQFPQYEGKKVLVFGLGLNDGGLGMVDFFIDQGAEVTITDGKTEEQLASTLEKLKEKGGKLTFHLGGHVESDFTDNDIIIRNPAIKPDNPYLKLAKDAGKTIEMEMSLFFKLAPCKIVGISGTKGKSTTTTLAYLMLKKKFGDSVILAGNIGKSAIRELPKLTKDNLVVL